MDSYNLFGDDGSGMLEGLTDLGGSDAFTGSSTTNVTGETKESSDNSYRQAYTQGSEKLASFGGSAGSGLSSNAAGVGGAGAGAGGAEYHEYGGYGPRARAPQPPLAPHHPPHHVHPAHPPHGYPGYHPAPDPMYAIPEHPGLGDMWSATAPGANRYSPITPGYRHGYEHQPKMHQYPQQGSAIGSMQPQNGSYMPRQPHFPQSPAQQVYGQQQSYPSYTQMHPPSASRIPQHPSYHQQMEVNPHQYGLPHGQQSHGAVPQHQPLQNMPGHPPGIGANIQNHPNAHPTHHHSGPPLHHMPRQPLPPSSGAPPSHTVPPQMPFSSPHHSVPMNYPHQAQHPLDVNVANQYNKPSGLETGSSQYRPPFPQLSPQVSPNRAQMSPRQQPSQLSPRPVMSPVKGPSASPHGPRNIQPPVSTGAPPPTSSYTSQNTLQALEQMVLPSGAEYPYQRNQNSPAMGHLASSPSQWNPNKIPTPSSINTITHQENDQTTKTLEPTQQHKLDPVKNIVKPANTELTTLDNSQSEVDRSNDNLMNQRNFMPPSSLASTSAPGTMLSSNMSQTNIATGNVPSVNIPATSVSANLPPSNIHSNIPHVATAKENSSNNAPTVSNTESTTNEKSQATEILHSQSEGKNDATLSAINDKHDISSVSNEQKVDTKPGSELSNKSNNELTKASHSVASTMPNPSESKNSMQQLPMSSSMRYENMNALNTNRNMPYQASNMQNLMPGMRPAVMPHNLPVSIPSSVPNSTHNMHQTFPSGPQSVPNGHPIVQAHSMTHSNLPTSISSTASHNQTNSMNLGGVPQNASNIPGNMPANVPPGMPPNSVPSMSTNAQGISPVTPPGISANAPAGMQSTTSNLTSSGPPGINPNTPPNMQLGTSTLPPNGPPALGPNTTQSMPQNTSGLQPNPPGMPSSASGMPPNNPGMPPNASGMPPNAPAGMPPNSGIPSNVPPGMTNIPIGMQIGGPNLHPPISNIQGNQSIPPGMQVNQSNMMPNMNHSPNMMVLGPNTMPHPNMPGMYPPASHHQERLALQQQIQEIYCLPPSNENQEKVRFLQEKLAMLQQHETNDKCNGGPNCALQNPVYGTKMVESPQVTSTTGRGRGKGPAKPRKPRAKKEKIPTNIPPLDQLPVSEDCVTAGTGLQSSTEPDQQQPETDITDLDSSALSIDEFPTAVKGKRGPRGPRKPKEPKEPRKPRVPKEPKNKEVADKPVKERKKREPKDPNAPRKKRASKKDMTEIQADTTTTTSVYDFTEKDALCTTLDSSKSVLNESSQKKETQDLSTLDDSTVTDFDDIPVSKIPIKELMEEAEAKRESYDLDDDYDSVTQKRKSKKRGSSGGRKATLKRTPVSGRRKKRGGIVPDSDGEPDDMMSTPPPSPPPEDDGLKRRSARNTQRKKYTDDVMIRLSDEEYSVSQAPKQDKICKNEDSNDVADAVIKLDSTPKPNYMYVNTTDEDSMIVHHVLASRMGKRELKPEPPPPPSVPVETSTDEIENKEEQGNSEISIKEELKDSEEPKDTESNTECKTETVEQETSEKKNDVVEKDNIDEANKDDIKKERTAPEVADVAEQPKSEESEQKDESDKDKKPPVMVDVEEYYVKYRNFSYLHCEWKTEEELYKGDKRIFSKIKRFKQKQAQQLNIFEILDEEPFNPDYIEVERILDVSENQDPANNTVVKHFLVKWKSLQYEDSTWELEEDIDVDKIKQFKIFNELPPKEKWKYKKRPSADHWVQLKESPLYKGANTLRPYQLEGLNWLLFSWHNNRNCILADEMGLGKTIQSLTFVNAVWEYGIRGPFLIIAPLSTIPNWQREFEGWTDMNVIVYHGSQQSKSMIQEYEFYYKNDKGEPIKDLTKFNVLITTFEIIVTDFHELKSFNWRVCVIDEAHRLKNRNCKLLEGLRQLHLEHRVLLSGTPLQNNVNELFSLLNFLEPTQFCSCEAFLNEFGQLKSESEVLKLQALLKPMMLRRLKEDVEKTLAPKEETIIEVELTNIQKKYYRAILERNFSFLQKGTASAANIPNLMNTMMELRKCCIHPYLLNGAEDQIQFDYKQAYGEDKEAYYKALIQSSGKMVLVDKLLPKLKAGGHRVLIFSQMVRCLDILEDYLMYRKYPFERIDGRIRGNLRQEAIDRFSKPDSDRFIFLLCTKAGGLGINLTAADTVIIYDSDWNPQNDLQAQARCHRIGQQKMVKIYRLICRNSYEREMFDKASLKLGLDKAILQSMNTTQGKETGLRQLSKKEIEDLLKKGAYGAVMDEDNAGDKFCEEDIEMILARRTQVIQMESEKGSTFSKASFAATDQRSDIDIRDPDFWNKWAKKADIDTTEKKEDEDLIVTEPRKRTVIKRYGHDEGPMEMSDEATPESDEDEEGISLRSKKKKEKFGKKGRRYESDDYIPRHEGVPIDEEVVYGSWTRSECFKIERGLLTFGWARWDEILDKNQFRKGWTMDVIEDCARIIVLYCLRHYKGDEKIRNFIWDLIEPCENGEVTISRNHSGLHNPVPRGRNAKKKNRPKDIPKPSDTQKWEDPNHWSSTEKYDCEAYLESSYKKHLFRHANKVLLRVRMMYYIKHEVIGDYAIQIDNGTHASAIGMRVPRGVDSAPPRLWWDSECDVSLLVGTYVHGYENYLAMRSDPQLCYVDKLGPPDDAECTDIKSEERKVRGSVVGEEECTDDVSSGAGATSPAGSVRGEEDAASHLWPSMQDLNTRLRRLITAYQRNYKREELKMQQRAKMERRDQLAREEASQWRWSRADEEAFRRTVASYGVEFDPATKSLRWNRFRALAKLESKSDDALTDYLKAFMAMCKRQCGLSVGEAELPTRPDLKAEPIGEERAIATLERIDLLRVLREEVAPHPLLEARLALCTRTPDAPPWWSPALHDEPLVLHVCRHGLGDTYRKIFCDPKLPFADCARKWLAKNKVTTKTESNNATSEDEEKKSESAYETRKSLRRSKRTSHAERTQDEDTDALSELETLAKLGRAEENLSPDLWFSERALETRLHHIAHTVQNNEWPAHKPDPVELDAKGGGKRHIAIDVETERAKLHALLSSPGGEAERGGARAAPAPPPAHQRPSPAPAPAGPAPSPAPAPSPSPAAAAPVDLSAPLDLSDAQDLSTRAAPAPSPASSPAPARSRLDDTLSKLMKRKNVPAPEQIVGKEKKRKKLDEIVLGLSAAKGQSTASMASTPSGERAGGAPDLRRATPPAPPPAPAQKPFSVTLTSVSASQPPSTKELSSFLQQSLEQSSKAAKTASVASSSAKLGYSHEAKVNKWLAEQARRSSAAAAAVAPPAPPRLSPDEHVPVVHRVTGKRIFGHKAPQLKHLAQWIAENPMYDIDPKWTEGIKEHVKLPQDVRSQRHSPMQSSSTMGERKKGRPPTLDSPSASVLSSSAHLGQNLSGLNPALLASLSSLSAFDPKSLAAFDPKTLAATLSNLTGFDPKLLGSFDPKLLNSFDPKLLSSFDPKLLSNLSNFDPKNNPLLSSFSQMPNLLGNIAGGNIFANLAGLGLPGFSSLDMNALSGATPSGESKAKSSRKPESGSSSSKTNSQFPFVFPSPNMLYPQLGLSGLNPFGMHSGMTSAYDALGLLGNNLASSSSSLHSAHSASRSATKTTTPRTSTVVTNSSTSRQQKVTDRQQATQLPQIMLPPDPFLLESLSKQTLNYESILKDKRSRETEQDSVATDLSKSDKKKLPMDALRSQMPPEFAAVQEKLLKGDKKDIDISKMLLEQMASGALSASLVSSAESSKKASSSERDAYEKMVKASDYTMRAQDDNMASNNSSMGHKRTHEEMSNEPENLAIPSNDSNPSKKIKDTPEVLSHGKTSDPHHTGEMDLEDLIAPSTVIKTGMKSSDIENVMPDTIVSQAVVNIEREENPQLKMSGLYHEARDSIIDQGTESGSKISEETAHVDDSSNIEDLSNDSARRGSRKKGRKSSDESTVSGPRRELRSSSGRQSTDTGN